MSVPSVPPASASNMLAPDCGEQVKSLMNEFTVGHQQKLNKIVCDGEWNWIEIIIVLEILL